MKLLSTILIITIALNVFCIGLYLGRLAHLEPNTCGGYEKALNELQVEKQQLIQMVAEKEQVIINMADENWLK